MEKNKESLTICVFCKTCKKPFSVSLAEYAVTDVELTEQNKQYEDDGYEVKLVRNFDGVWCDCK